MKDFAKKYFEKNGYKRFTCDICGCDFYDFTGNNPYPIIKDENSVCCSLCNSLFIIPQREELDDEFEDEFEDDEDFDGYGLQIMTIPVEIVIDQIFPAIEDAMKAAADNQALLRSLLNAKQWLTYSIENKTYTQD